MAKNKTKKSKQDEAPSTSKAATKQTQNDAAGNNEIWQDSRFQHLLSDPRFKNLPKAQRKVKIDKRFQSMFTDKKFNVKYTVDKYGRRINKSSGEDLQKYYELNSDEDSEADEKKVTGEDEEAGSLDETKPSDSDEDEIVAEQRKEEKAISREADDEVKKDENDELVSDGEDVPKALRDRLFDPQIDYARGEGRLISDSSSDEESSEDDEEDDTYLEHNWAELDAEAERTDESTRRLAVCNMDWDRIRAMDLMMLFSSFLPPGGSIESVKIYMSEFGKERMKIEEEKGPAELVGLGKEVNADQQYSSDDDSDDEFVKAQDSDAEEGDEYHMEKLRQYQLNRLRYYYAVVECDSVASADKIYAECDGIEYESSATRMDLRFIPDDTSFDEDEPTDVCKELPDTNTYQPRLFTNTALQQAKVDLTWDETAVERQELSERLLAGKLEEVNDKDLRKIVAYSSEEEEDSDVDEGEKNEAEPKTTFTEETSQTKSTATEKPKKSKKDDYINKYKALLAEINEKEQEEKNKKFEMELSWDVNEKKASDNDDENDAELEKKPNSELTPIEKVLKKRNEKNKQRKLERKKKKLLAKGIDPDAAGNESDFDSLPDGIDMNDPYFAEEFANGDYIDPKSKKREKKKSQLEKQALEEEEAKKQAKELELLLDDDDEEQQGKQHFSLEKIQKSEQETKSKRKRRKQLKKSKAEISAQTKEIEDNFKLDTDDSRFKALYTSPLFNIDPTDSHFKKTKGMEHLIHEKLKRRHGNDLNGGGKYVETNGMSPMEPEMKKPKKQLEQTLLVKSLKRKLQGK